MKHVVQVPRFVEKGALEVTQQLAQEAGEKDA
jgi:hypothetical protein